MITRPIKEELYIIRGRRNVGVCRTFVVDRSVTTKSVAHSTSLVKRDKCNTTGWSLLILDDRQGREGHRSYKLRQISDQATHETRPTFNISARGHLIFSFSLIRLDQIEASFEIGLRKLFNWN